MSDLNRFTVNELTQIMHWIEDELEPLRDVEGFVMDSDNYKRLRAMEAKVSNALNRGNCYRCGQPIHLRYRCFPNPCDMAYYDKERTKTTA